MSLTPQQAIYQITRAVYARLGDNADRQLVEALVTDIFNSFYPLLNQLEPASDNTQSLIGDKREFERREVEGRKGVGSSGSSRVSSESGVGDERSAGVFSLGSDWEGNERNDDARAQRYIISVFGLDQPGIVSVVAGMLADAQCSIIDINQTVVQRKFAMIMIIDATRTTRDMAKLREEFRIAGERLGVRIYMQREDIFHAMHRV